MRRFFGRTLHYLHFNLLIHYSIQLANTFVKTYSFLHMDHINQSLQLMRAAAYVVLQLQAVAQWLLYLEENDGPPRSKSVFQQRLAWDTFVANNRNRPLFKRHLRMSYESFCNLMSLIEHQQKDVNSDMANLRGGEVIKELRLYLTIRYLAGGSYSDICFFCGISTSTLYRVLWDTIAAITCRRYNTRHWYFSQLRT